MNSAQQKCILFNYKLGPITMLKIRPLILNLLGKFLSCLMEGKTLSCLTLYVSTLIENREISISSVSMKQHI